MREFYNHLKGNAESEIEYVWQFGNKKVFLEAHSDYNTLENYRKKLPPELDPILDKTKEKFLAFIFITKLYYDD